jgi:hypothetical protein
MHRSRCQEAGINVKNINIYARYKQRLFKGSFSFIITFAPLNDHLKITK